MNYYVNLYFLPEPWQVDGRDNIEIGSLCRSLKCAYQEAIERHLFKPENLRHQYVGTLNDPITTKYILSYIADIEGKIKEMSYDLRAIPDNLDDFEESYATHKEERPPETTHRWR